MMLIGQPFYEPNFSLPEAGKAYLFFGRSSWVDVVEISDEYADASFKGDTAVDNVGWSLSRAGDMNDDS